MNPNSNSNNTENQALRKEDMWKSFLDAIESYTTSRKYSEQLPEIINQGLQVFLEIPHSEAASLFILKEDTFEFEHRTTVPNENSSKLIEIYEFLLDQGIIGTTLESGNIIIHPTDEKPDNQFGSLVAPLIVSWGVLGIVIIKIKNPNAIFNQMFYRLCSLHGSLFASTLENSILFRNLDKSKSILEQKVAARTMDLAQSQRELNAILNFVQTGIVVVNAETKNIIRVNPVAVDLIGVEEDNILGRKYTEFMTQINKEIIGDGTKIKSAKNFESELTRPDGKKIPILRTTAYINLGNKQLFIESFLDITDRKNAENALLESNELLELKVQERTEDLHVLIHKLKEEIAVRERAELEAKKMLEKEKELSELKTKFVSMVSHEFRTPLTVIKSAAQMISRFKEKLSGEEQDDYLFRIMKTVDVVTDLIENVIFIGKKDANKMLSTPSTIILVDFCTQIIKDLQLSFTTPRQINFKYSSIDLTLWGDEKLLRLIILNLLSNAIKYSDDSQPVELVLDSDENFVIFKIIDYGIGIPIVDQEQIFDLFYRAENVGSRSGTGLGLAVVMQSLQALNGEMDLSSRENKGTTFTVKIPKTTKNRVKK